MPTMNAEARGPRLAYLTTRYPAVSHSFIQREILALRDLGAEIETFSIHPPIPADLFTQVDRAEAARTFSVRSCPWRKIAGAHLHALIRHPRAYLSTLRFSASQASGSGRLLAPVFHFAEAVVVWRECRRRGIRHIHAHFTSPSADVALFAAHLGEGVSPERSPGASPRMAPTFSAILRRGSPKRCGGPRWSSASATSVALN